MKSKPLPERNPVQRTFESVLKWGIPVMAFLHIALILLSYFLTDTVNNALHASEKWIVIIFLGAALAYLVYTLIAIPKQLSRFREYLKGLFRPEMILLLLFLIWFLLCTSSANKIYNGNFWKYNDPALFEVFVSFFVFFAFAYVLKQQSVRIMEILFHAIAITMTGLMIWVLCIVCKPSVFNLPGGGQIGMTSKARLVINCNPNTTGANSEVILMICLYMAITKKGIIRILYSMATLIHYFILILSDSRTCILATAFSIGLIAFKLVFDATNGKTTMKRFLFGLISFIACIAFVVGLQNPVRHLYEAISHFPATAREIELTTNSRLELWIASVKSAFSDSRHALFGVTPVAVISEIERLTGRSLYTHNQFAEILVSNGLPGVLLYVSWLILIARKSFRNMLILTNRTRIGTVIIHGMIIMLVISNLYEATLMYYRFITGSLFFLFCGMIAFEDSEKHEQKTIFSVKKVIKKP